jgi:hypothetical protein
VPEGYRYPHPDSYQVFYIDSVTKILPFTPTAEAGDRAFFTLEDALNQKWTQENHLMFNAARNKMGYFD